MGIHDEYTCTLYMYINIIILLFQYVLKNYLPFEFCTCMFDHETITHILS